MMNVRFFEGYDDPVLFTWHDAVDAPAIGSEVYHDTPNGYELFRVIRVQWRLTAGVYVVDCYLLLESKYECPS